QPQLLITTTAKKSEFVIMARVPMGKVLLRNVIRHTDAHNKIQEESEMWKLRDMERQTSSSHASKHRWMTSTHLAKSNMHCDRYLDDSEGSARDRLGERRCLSEKDEREARYWTRKLYDFEANDPDRQVLLLSTRLLRFIYNHFDSKNISLHRWGHSGFKELYPEEFQSDGETDCTKRSKKNGKGKTASDRQKNSKKTSKKKKKKKKKKQRTTGSDSETDGSTVDSVKGKQKRKSGKSKHSKKKRHKSKERYVDSSTEDSESGRHGDRRKRHRTADTQAEPERKRRKDWKTNEEKSEDSSED
ncbi:hypothetical protein NFI96_015667, partial [Prochilodus magdalenae]